MKSRVLLVATLAVAATACRLTTPPDPNSGLAPAATVYAPVIEEEIGSLFVQSNGLWAFRTPEPARVEAFEVGSLAVFGDADATERHLFAVTQTHDWGVVLQRLDAEPIRGRSSGTLVPLSVLDSPTGVRWGFCAGEGDLRTADCLDQGPPGTHWRIYPRNGTRVVLTDWSADRGTLPVELAGRVAVHPYGRDVMALQQPTKWLAVPTATVSPRPPRPRIVVANGCDVGSPHREALDAQWIRADFAPPADPLQTTSRAIEHGADALVWCDGDKTRVAVPTVYRPRIDVAGRDFAIPPMFGVRPVEIGLKARPAVDFIARLGAAHAQGDFATGDYLAEQLMRRFDFKRPLDRVLVDSMAAIATGGRPEAAARLGQWATRLQWNPKNSASWQLGMASIETAVGNRQAAIARTAGLTEVLDNLGDDERRAWVAYFWAIAQIGARGAIRDYTEPFADHTPLVLAARAHAAQASGKALDELRPEFESASALEAWRALASELSPLECTAEECAADVYGRLWMAGHVDARALSRVPTTFLQPGYAMPPDQPGIAGLELLVAVYPLVADDDNQLLDSATALAVEWVRSQCTSDDASEQLSRLEQAGVDADLRTPDQRPMGATMVWLATRGVRAACSDTATLAIASVELAEDVGIATVPADLLALHIDQAPEPELLSTLETAANFAVEYEHGERCASWTVALASAYAEAGELRRARDWIQHAARCDVTERDAIDLVSAYLNFQRTSTTSADFAESTRKTLRSVAHVDVATDECVGIKALDYQLLNALPAGERTLAERLRVPAAKRNESLSLVTADDRLAIAREHLSEVLTAMDAREFVKAATSLGHARAAFEGIGHEIGIARVRFLDQFLFGGNAEKVASAELEFKAVGLAPMRKKGALTELAKANADVRLALALLRDDVKAAAPLVQKAEPTLCEASPRRVRNVLIDRVDGQLQNTRPRDDGPEIELVEP